MTAAPADPLRRSILIGWALASLVLIAVSAGDILALRFPDPDDAMRYVEVRDWLAGQSWWDVSQHRLWDGHFAMHWSRLVDLPLAAAMALLDPLVGTDWSGRIASTLVPLLTLGALIAVAARLTRRLAGVEPAQIAVLLTPLAVPIVYQMRPLRIDHHGWQVVAAMIAVTMLAAHRRARSGAIAGAALATLLTISMEGMPITAAIAGVAMLAALRDPARRGQALALAATLPAVLVALHVATRGPASLAFACDAIAPVWIVALGVALVGCIVALAPHRLTPVARLAIMAAGGAAGLALLRLAAPQCLAGPFATLDPLVYRFWYQNVSEGLPIWQQLPGPAAMTIGFPMFGLIGAALAWRGAQGRQRERWTIVLALAFASLGLSLLVVRTGATANAIALPGGAVLLYRLLARARAIQLVLRRTAATAGAFLLATPGIAASALLEMPTEGATLAADPRGAQRAVCHRGREAADYARLPAARLFAPLDITPAILAHTPHRAIASGYHRNSAAIHDVIATFLAGPEEARARVQASGADYVVGCPGENETELYRKVAPDGFWARLERGERFDWLRPVDLGSPALAWRVVRPLPSPTPRP